MIDTKRLATDAAYWRECGAPEDASHVHAISGRLLRKITGIWWIWCLPTPGCGFWEETCWPSVNPEHIIPRPNPLQMEWPESGSKWEHHSGRVYAVIDIANGKTERPEQYPVTVIYQNVDNGTLWSRPLNDWDRSFKPYRTKEQRKMEELVNIVCSQGFLSKDGNVSWEIADAILSRYTLEPKP